VETFVVTTREAVVAAVGVAVVPVKALADAVVGTLPLVGLVLDAFVFVVGVARRAFVVAAVVLVVHQLAAVPLDVLHAPVLTHHAGLSLGRCIAGYET